jgi:DNA-cytosine methyltransferase
MQNKISFFSTHSGGGLADAGARMAFGGGVVEPIGGIEIDEYCVNLHRQIFGDGMRHESILDTPIEQLPDFDMLWSSPSCQKFSSSNKEKGETQLDIEIAQKIAKIIKVKTPKYFALENVRGYLYKPKKEWDNKDIPEFTDSFKIIYEQIKELGYNVDYKIINALNFGVAQDRDRLIIRASQDKLPPLVETHAKEETFFHKPWVGWGIALGKIEELGLKRAVLTEKQAQKISILGDRAQYPLIIERVGYGYGKLPNIRFWHEPCWTIRASLGCDEKGGFRSPITLVLGPNKAYHLDYRCLARLQSVPDDYVWGPSAGRNCKVIGNGVPSLLAKVVVESFFDR